MPGPVSGPDLFFPVWCNLAGVGCLVVRASSIYITGRRTTGDEHVVLPCKREIGIRIPLGDHAFVVQDFIIEQSNGRRHC